MNRLFNSVGAAALGGPQRELEDIHFAAATILW
jgi:hypothetical protein